MKNIIFLFIAFIIPAFSFSQEYHPMLGDTNVWKVRYYFESIITETFVTKGDTTIDSLTYKIIGWASGTNEFAYLREDTLEKKVYCRPPAYINFSSEYVFYDFSLIENDSILLFDYYYDYPGNFDTLGYYYVDSIRLINTYEGQRKIFYFSKPSAQFWEYPVWIEGVGTLGHPLHPGQSPIEGPYGGEFGYLLSCFFRNDILVYQSQESIEYETCDIDISNIEEKKYSLKKKNIILYDMGNGLFNIKSFNNKIKKLCIISIDGKLIFKNIYNTWDVQINLKNQIAGFYCVRIIDEKNNVSLIKLIKTK
ncbi:MAG: T9SS type A sorting domain-containing protein [Bacteroidia bacterium]|nr:T9SS type A sorting domain-containing protein [Bacteroidia bacterium]